MYQKLRVHTRLQNSRYFSAQFAARKGAKRRERDPRPQGVWTVVIFPLNSLLVPLSVFTLTPDLLFEDRAS